MNNWEVKVVDRAIREMTWAQRRELMQHLAVTQSGAEADAIVEDRLQAQRNCPHCQDKHVVRRGRACGLQRYRCRGCGKTFNARTGTPLARLRCRDRWLGQTQALIDGLSISFDAQPLQVARSTALRWRHRLLTLPHQVKAARLDDIVEADETCRLKSRRSQRGRRREPGRPARARGGRAAKRGMSSEHDIVLVVRDRSGACTDQIVKKLDTAHLAAEVRPALAAGAVLCTDGSAALGAAALYIGIEHHAINASAGQHAIGPWHSNNVNCHHSRLKVWL